MAAQQRQRQQSEAAAAAAAQQGAGAGGQTGRAVGLTPELVELQRELVAAAQQVRGAGVCVCVCLGGGGEWRKARRWMG